MSAQNLTRRQAIVAAAGVASVSAVPALALSVHASGPDAPAAYHLLVAAETEITRLYAGWDDCQTDKETDEITSRAWLLDDFIATAAPASLADCAVKLRRVLDREVGMVAGANDRDVPALAQVLDYIESVTGAPTHPTRPTAREWKIGDGT